MRACQELIEKSRSCFKGSAEAASLCDPVPCMWEARFRIEEPSCSEAFQSLGLLSAGDAGQWRKRYLALTGRSLHSALHIREGNACVTRPHKGFEDCHDSQFWYCPHVKLHNHTHGKINVDTYTHLSILIFKRCNASNVV